MIHLWQRLLKETQLQYEVGSGVLTQEVWAKFLRNIIFMNHDIIFRNLLGYFPLNLMVVLIISDIL